MISLAASPERGASAAMSPPRILIVDDDEFVRDMSARLLESVGYAVDTADDGQAGWSAVCSRHYDLVITDYDMPRMKGLELIRRMHAAGLPVPIVMVSGLQPEEIGLPADRSIPAFKAFLQKPFGPREFLRVVEEVVGVPAAVAG